MKNVYKTLAVIFSIIAILTFCSCNANNDADSATSLPVLEEDSTIPQTLIHRISANDDLDTIESIIICEETCTSISPLMDKDNFDFLQKYTFSHTKTDKRENWNIWIKENSTLTLTVKTKTQGEYSLYLIGDGTIAIQEMCGDSEVPEITYEFYEAEKQDILVKESIKLISSQ